MLRLRWLGWLGWLGSLTGRLLFVGAGVVGSVEGGLVCAVELLGVAVEVVGGGWL